MPRNRSSRRSRPPGGSGEAATVADFSVNLGSTRCFTTAFTFVAPRRALRGAIERGARPRPGFRASLAPIFQFSRQVSLEKAFCDSYAITPAYRPLLRPVSARKVELG